ncbi:MAG TPA: Holliday junction branch migration protein RuvA [Steroidobacteraceae bacterium]|jgi:Holliday junction DNA helicase RuvA|nr:Holliday junction branch migration protein RuvA [Steroidobacteraceae bacterium]
MIGHLRGRLVRKAPPALIVDVNGVGYELEAPMSTFYRLPELGSEVELATHLVVREDAHLLYGFATEDERRLFRDLLRVTGIGPKIGLALLSGIDVDTFMRCVEAQDVAALTRIPGIGRKTAERLLVEMRDRISALGQMPASAPKSAGGARAEAYAALVALGYRPVEVNRLLQGVEQEGAGTEELIRRALQAAAR